ncbi:hypothetical protein X759_35250 [Mesorhizobium sp. LSHC420B00]|nr:hypothetical protein X759_35250 [Mesorhizobium sp. LSHC420B00]
MQRPAMVENHDHAIELAVEIVSSPSQTLRISPA